ncbi:hypothetical protein RQP46_003181 [Phenoliferia psychrophenolica]
MPTTDTTRAKKAAGQKKKTSIANTKPGGTKKAKSSSYNKVGLIAARAPTRFRSDICRSLQYMTDKLAELKAENPAQDQKDRMKAVVAMWKASPVFHLDTGCVANVGLGNVEGPKGEMSGVRARPAAATIDSGSLLWRPSPIPK